MNRPPDNARLADASDAALLAARERLVASFEAAHPLPTEIAGPVDWPALMAAQARAFVAFALAHREVGEAVFHSDFARRRPPALDATLRIEAMIRAGQEAEAFGPVDPAATARLLYAAAEETHRAIAAGAPRAATEAALLELARRTLAR